MPRKKTKSSSPPPTPSKKHKVSKEAEIVYSHKGAQFTREQIANMDSAQIAFNANKQSNCKFFVCLDYKSTLYGEIMV